MFKGEYSTYSNHITMTDDKVNNMFSIFLMENIDGMIKSLNIKVEVSADNREETETLISDTLGKIGIEKDIWELTEEDIEPYRQLPGVIITLCEE